MGGEVYGDILFLINFSMDLLCFYLTSRLLHHRINMPRAVVASLLGGAYAVAALLIDVGAGVAFVFDIAVCFFMCLLAFGGKRETRPALSRLVLMFGVYVVVSMVVGGVMTALYNLLNRSGLPQKLPEVFSGEDDGVSTWMFVILAAVAGFLALWGGRLFRRSTAARPCDVRIVIGAREVCIRGMCDSGNLLRDPVSGKAVIAVDRGALGGILSAELLDRLSHGERGISEMLDDTSEEARRLLKKVRVIPTGTAIGKGLLVAISPDRMTVKPLDGEEHEVDALFAPIDMVGAEKSLGKNAKRNLRHDTEGKAGDLVQALVPSELMM